jgi:hypothetical protein
VPVASKPRNQGEIVQGSLHQFNKDIYNGKIGISREPISPESDNLSRDLLSAKKEMATGMNSSRYHNNQLLNQ